MSERKTVAKKVKQLGMADVVDHQCTAQELRDKSIRLLQDP